MVTTKFAVKSEIYQVPMRDGVKLSVHVHRPDAEGAFPAILEFTPYRKGPLRGHHPIVEHGYATVTFDIRGTGNSEGWNESMYCATTRQDGYDMVEWAAAQPWCSGNVGMWGISFGAVVTLQTAGMAPPHLKAAIARSGTDDPFTEWTNPGGSPRPYMYQCYSPIMTAANFSPPDPEEVGERWSAIWEERLAHNVPWGIGFIEHLEDGPFWRDRSLRDHYDRVQCPVFVVDGWADWYPTPLLRTFANLTVPKRALIGPWSHLWPGDALPGPRIDWLSESLKWFDYWLKGIDTGVMDEPPVTIFVREFSKPTSLLIEDAGEFRSEQEWPIARTLQIPYFFQPDGRLENRPAADTAADAFDYDPRVGASTGMHGGGPYNINWMMPLDQRPDNAVSLTYTTEPLAEDLEIAGNPRLDLHFSSSTDAGLLFIKLCDVAPDGTSVLVTKGYLNVAYRESREAMSPVEPDIVYPLEIDMLACAYRFKAGHRIRVSIAGGDLYNIWPVSKPGTGSIHRAPAAPSHIVLPVIPAQSPAVSAPRLTVLTDPLPSRDSLTPPGTVVTSRDPINETASVRCTVNYGPYWSNASELTVSAREPAKATLRAGSTYRHDYAGREIVVDVQCDTSSDAQAFHHTVELEITVNGKLHTQKHWSVSVPRKGI